MSSHDDPRSLDTPHDTPQDRPHQFGQDEMDADTSQSLARLESLFSRVRLPPELEVNPDEWLEEPLQLPGFRSLSLLGRGGFGRVFLAYDERLEREVAVKAIHDKPWLHDERAENAWREAKMVARLQHPGIVPLYEVIVHEGRGHLVSAYMNGGTLENKLAEGPLPTHDAARITLQLAEALAYAHSQNIVHCDLKPSNILFDSLGQARIADFGLAINDTTMSADEPAMAGTLEYMAPEQIPGSTPYRDGRTDIWSLGVVLYRMLTGCMPFRGTTRSELQSAIQHRPVKPPRQFASNIPELLQTICLRCLEKKPEDRWSSAADVAQKLRHFLESQPTYSPSIRHRRVILTTALLLSLLAWWWFARNPHRSTAETPSHLAANRSATTYDRSLAIETLRWSQFRFHADGRGFDLGTVGYNSQPFYTHDELRLELKLSRPALTYILEMNPRGELLLAEPSSEDETPTARTTLEFPDDPSSYYGFDAGPGMYAVCVIASTKPLPAFRQWKATLPTFNWSGRVTSHDAIWHYANHGFEGGHFIRQRGSVHQRAKPPADLAQFCHTLATHCKEATVHVTAIPVETLDPANSP